MVAPIAKIMAATKETRRLVKTAESLPARGVAQEAAIM